MEDIYLRNSMRYARAWIMVLIAGLFSLNANAQSITINSVTAGPYYTFQDLEVDYTAAGYPAGTTFYLVLDTNGNGYLDAEDDNEDYVLASSTSTSGILTGEVPFETGTQDFYIVAGEDGTLGDVIAESSLTNADISPNPPSGSVSADFPYVMNQDMTTREIETVSFDMTSDFYHIMVVNVTATDVVPANELVFEYSTDGGTTYTALTDQQGNDAFSASDGELIFALSQSLNVSDIQFRLSQNNSATILAADENWTLNGIDVIEYGGTLVQYNEQSAGSLFINAPDFDINSTTFDTYIGEDIEVDYTANGFTSGANFYLYTGNILDPDDRHIYDTEISVSSIFTSTWPLNFGDDTHNVRIAGIYGNIDNPEIDFENDLAIIGSSSSGYWYLFNEEGVRSATTDPMDLTGEDYITLNVGLDPLDNLTTDHALLVQYSTDGTTWVDMESNDGTDEITGTTSNTYNYTIPGAAKTATTRFRVVQKSIDSGTNVNRWYLHDFNIQFYVVGADQFVASPFVNNYAVTVSTINDVDDVNITGGSAYPGDEITVLADVAGFDVNTETYTALINNEFLLDNPVVAIDGVTDEISVTGTIPLNIDYVNGAEISVKIYDGADPLVQVNENVFDDYDLETDVPVEGGEIDDVNKWADFTMDGTRSLTTPSFEIASIDDLTLEFNLRRLNPVRSPSGTEVVVEYSTNGTDYTEIQSFSINEAGEGGETFSIDNTTLPAGVASMSTTIRFRQASHNGPDLDSWRIQNITLMGGTNISDPGYINYNTQNLDILEPVISLTAIDNVNSTFYPGDDLSVEFDVTGQFPAGTTYELIMVRDLGGSISFGDFSAAGTHNVVVPSVIGATYSLLVRSSHDEVESNQVDLVVSSVEISNISITSTDAVTDGSDQIVYPGNTIDITYDLNVDPATDLSADARINLEIFDNETDEYIMIVEGDAIDGDVSATLPVGIDYNSNNADFRFTITNGNLSAFDLSIDEYWSSDQTVADMYFPLDQREGAYSCCNYFIYADGMRSATSIPLDFSGGARVRLDLYSPWYDHPEDIHLEYSIDEGETWENIVTETMSSTAQIFPNFVDIPEEAWMENVLIRWINSETYTASEYLNGFYFRGFELENYHLVPVSLEDFTLQPHLILEELSVSMSTLEDTNFKLGEEFVLEYNAEGPFPTGTDFAVVMEQSGEVKLLAESDQTGAVQLTVNIPSVPFEDPNNPYNLKVVPFQKVGTNDFYRPGADEEDIENEEDIVSIEGYNACCGFDDLRFTEVGERFVETRDFDLEAYGTATLEFSFTWYDGDVSSLLTLPELQVSTDGGATWETLPVTGSEYEAEGLVYPSGSYEVDIPAPYLTATTRFRWIQKLNLGQNEDDWRLYNMTVAKGETNELNDDIYTTFNMPQSINVTIPAVGNYIWRQNDMTDAVFNGETFDYLWDFDPDALEESDFPAGTEFIFSINREDPLTGENLIIGTTSTLGVSQATVPSYLETQDYTVYVTSFVTVDGEDYIIHDNETVGTLSLFLQVVKTTLVTANPEARVYAGDAATFSYEVVNNETTAGTIYDDLFYNLIIESAYNGEDYLLASQQGLGTDFSVTIPEWLQDNDWDFVVKASEGAALGTDGTFLGLDRPEDIDNGTTNQNEYFFNFDDKMSGTTLRATTGLRDLSTKDLDVTEAQAIEFELYFDREIHELGSTQLLVFEYSVDEGATFTTLETFPRAADEGGIINFERIFLLLPAEAQSAATRFRWRQDDSEGTIQLDDITVNYAPEFPFLTEEHNQYVTRQLVQVESFGSAVVCPDDDVTINYSVRGGFGSATNIRVYYRDQNDESDDENTGYDFPLSVDGSGNGSLTFSLPADYFDDYGFNNKEMEFALRAQDLSFVETPGIMDDFFSTYSSTTNFSATTVEYISPIHINAEFYFDDDQYECDVQDMLVYIDDLQDYFTYQFVNAADGTDVGSPLTYDPETNIEYVNIGAVTSPIELQMRITSGSADGSITCNTITSTYTDQLVVRPMYELYMSNNSGSTYMVSPAGATEIICEGTSEVRLRAGRISSNSTSPSYTSNIEWFRNDLGTPVDVDIQTLQSFPQSGNYFARVTDQSCTYVTESIDITVINKPDKPDITVVSGALTACEGAAPVVLDAPAGFEYYLWSNGATTQSISVETSGSYSVEVSNFPFGSSGTCESESSTNVVVQRLTLPDFAISTDEAITTGRIGDGDSFTECESMRVRFYDNTTQTASGGTIEVIRDGADYASTTSSFYDLEESGTYMFTWVNEDLNANCTVSSVSFDLTIVDQPDQAPVLTSTGNLTYCDGEGSVTLTAPAGFTRYWWYRNGSLLNSTQDGFDANSNSVVVTQGGDYTVAVGNLNSCASPRSNVIIVNVRSLPGIPNFGQQDATCGEGPITFWISSAQIDYTYQLIDATTGMASGNPVNGNDGTTYITSGSIMEATEFYMQVSYADGSGCTNFNEFSRSTGTPDNVHLELDGTTLRAVISNWSGYNEIRWFRDDMLLRNQTGTTITVMDAATYRVEVDFEGAGTCTQGSSAIDLSGGSSGRVSSHAINASAYPNPSVTGEINVEIGGEDYGEYEVKIISITGSISHSRILDKQDENFSHKISIDHLESGIYNVQISKDGLTRNLRIIKI